MPRVREEIEPRRPMSKDRNQDAKDPSEKMYMSEEQKRVNSEWSRIRNKEKILKEFFQFFIAFQVLDASKLMCPVDKEFWNWVFGLFPRQSANEDQDSFRKYEVQWIKFLLHKKKFFDAFKFWFTTYAHSIYENDQSEYRRENLRNTYKYLKNIINEIENSIPDQNNELIKYNRSDTQYVAQLTELGQLMEYKPDIMNDVNDLVEDHKCSEEINCYGLAEKQLNLSMNYSALKFYQKSCTRSLANYLQESSQDFSQQVRDLNRQFEISVSPYYSYSFR